MTLHGTPQPAATSPTRAFSTPFKPSESRWTHVSYTVRLDAVAGTTLLSGTAVAGRIELRSDSANPPTTALKTTRKSLRVAQILGLSVGINVTSVDDRELSAWIAPGDFVSIVPVDETNTLTYTLVNAQEKVV